MSDTYTTIIELTLKSLKLKKRFPELSLVMSTKAEEQLKKFWSAYKSNREENLNPYDWVSHNHAFKNTGISRHHIRMLVKDGMVREKDGKVCYPDVKTIWELLRYFEGAMEVKIIKEVDITGSKKYLMFDFQKNKGGKNLLDYQFELMLRMLNDFVSFSPDVIETDNAIFFPKDYSLEQKIEYLKKHEENKRG